MNESIHGVKLLLSYEVLPESSQEYYEFVMGRYIPAMQAMGMQMSEAWHTAYGDAPNRLIGFVCENRQTMDELLHSQTWLALTEQLKRYVTNLSYKVIPYKEGFQI
ncbi:MAG: hypothetical protein ACE5E7_06370 [Anaerolineae bacterium]